MATVNKRTNRLLAGLGVLSISSFLVPAVMFMAAGMAPTFVAAAIDRRAERFRTLCVGGLHSGDEMLWLDKDMRTRFEHGPEAVCLELTSLAQHTRLTLKRGQNASHIDETARCGLHFPSFDRCRRITLR